MLFWVDKEKEMSVKQKKTISLCVIAVACIAAAFLYLGDGFGSKAVYEPYGQFYEEAGKGLIESVSIGEKNVSFSKKDSDERYRTENPESPLLKEYLLKNNVEVQVEKSGSEIFSNIMDFLFYGFFIFIVFMVFSKFISPNTFKVVHHTGKSFKDVVGMDGLKKDMLQIMDIMLRPAEYRNRGVRMPKGIILEGDPGNGKTLFAKALAGESKVNFIPAKATDFESMFMAIGPMKVKLLFKKARRRAPCIVFIDEFDGIGTRRNYSGSAIETENTRIVTALLNELDGFEANKGILVIAATNSIKALDEALIRPGRFDARFTVPYPDKESIKKLVEMYSANKKRSTECSTDVLSDRFRGFSCSKIESVLNRASLVAAQDSREEFTLKDVDEACSEQKSAR